MTADNKLNAECVLEKKYDIYLKDSSPKIEISVVAVVVVIFSNPYNYSGVVTRHDIHVIFSNVKKKQNNRR